MLLCIVNPQYYYMTINNISKGVDWQFFFFRIFRIFFSGGTAKFLSIKSISYRESARINNLQIFLHLEPTKLILEVAFIDLKKRRPLVVPDCTSTKIVSLMHIEY